MAPLKRFTKCQRGEIGWRGSLQHGRVFPSAGHPSPTPTRPADVVDLVDRADRSSLRCRSVRLLHGVH